MERRSHPKKENVLPSSCNSGREATHTRILKTEPFLPRHLSPDAKSFLSLTLQKEPGERPAPEELLQHAWLHFSAEEGKTAGEMTSHSFPRREPSAAAVPDSAKKSRAFQAIEDKGLSTVEGSPQPDLIPAQRSARLPPSDEAAQRAKGRTVGLAQGTPRPATRQNDPDRTSFVRHSG